MFVFVRNNVLGFKEKPVPEVAKPLGWIWFYTGTGAVELHTVPDATALPKDPTHHFRIEVDDLDRVPRQQLRHLRQKTAGTRSHGV